MDTASTSPGPNVQTYPPSQRNGFNHSQEHRTEADDKNAPVASHKEQHGNGGKNTHVADAKAKEPTSTNLTKEENAAAAAAAAANEAQEKAGDVTESVKETAKETASEAKEAVTEKVEEVTESKSEDKEEAKEEKPKSKNPQDFDPGYTAQKSPGHIGTMSGKQEGLSNTDTSHPVC
jgi:hypothetical protein